MEKRTKILAVTVAGLIALDAGLNVYKYTKYGSPPAEAALLARVIKAATAPQADPARLTIEETLAAAVIDRENRRLSILVTRMMLQAKPDFPYLDKKNTNNIITFTIDDDGCKTASIQSRLPNGKLTPARPVPYLGNQKACDISLIGHSI